ncbi:hypothetical protein EJP61_02335 [Escherichia coli]|nr:hypothetical protein [Escherichia coli]EIA37239.1 hypothetical protein OQA_04841 [Escherichia coli SCI-07]
MVTISLFPTKEALAAPRQLLTKVNFINSELSYLERFYQETTQVLFSLTVKGYLTGGENHENRRGEYHLNSYCKSKTEKLLTDNYQEERER